MASKFRLTKKSAIFLGIAIVILSGALGYLIWRVNQVDTTAPTDSDAYGSCPGTCVVRTDGKPGCANQCWWECIDGTKLAGDYKDGACKEHGGSYKQGIQCDECKVEDVLPEGFYKEHSACQDIADQRNTPIGMVGLDSCTKYPKNSKWECKEVFQPDGFTLGYNACSSGTEKPTVDCGTEPDYPFNKAPTVIGPFPEDGKVVLYYKSLLDKEYRPKLTFRYKDSDGKTVDKAIKMPALDGDNRVRFVTEIPIKAKQSITLLSSSDDRVQNNPECAPAEDVNPKYMSWGWIAPSGNECGTRLPGPPTNGKQSPMEPTGVTSEITWAQSFGKQIVAKQCWADWREWPGDYDFNDYFLQVSYEPDEVIIETNPDWDISKSATSLCLEDNTDNAQSQLTYTITVKNTGDGAGTISKIEDTLDSKVLDSFVKTNTISDSGVYSNGKITWTFSTPLSIAAGTTKTFTYQILVSQDGFGTYSNKVKLTPVGSDPIEAVTDIVASCTIPGVVTPGTPGESVPQTGLFDTTIGRIVGGFVLLLLGGIVYNLPSINRNNFKYREKFEKKVANR